VIDEADIERQIDDLLNKKSAASSYEKRYTAIQTLSMLLIASRLGRLAKLIGDDR
jgi:hypothetical protein